MEELIKLNAKFTKDFDQLIKNRHFQEAEKLCRDLTSLMSTIYSEDINLYFMKNLDYDLTSIREYNEKALLSISNIHFNDALGEVTSIIGGKVQKTSGIDISKIVDRYLNISEDVKKVITIKLCSEPYYSTLVYHHHFRESLAN